jgi:hypothetical protein
MDVNSIATKETPEIQFDTKKGTLSLTGRSFPENAIEFYSELDKAVFSYIQNPQPHTSIAINLVYYNTATSKILVKLLMYFEPLPKKGFDVNIKWYYATNDEIIFEKGEEIKSVIYLPFELVAI